MNIVRKLACVVVFVAAAVTARADSINNYQVLQYLESSGTQAIDTGVKFGSPTRLYVRMQLLSNTTGGQIGAIDHHSGDSYDRFHFNVNNSILGLWADRYGYTSGSII